MARRKQNIAVLVRSMHIFHSVVGYSLQFIVFAMALWVPISQAQEVPDTVAPGRVEEQFKPLQIPQSGGDPIVPDSKPFVAPPESLNIEFVLKEIQFKYQGAATTTTDYQGIYPQSAFRSEYEMLLGTPVTVAQIYEVANKITAAYRNKGYVLSRAYLPQQEIGEQGVVTINILEGFINKVNIKGVDDNSVSQLKRYSDKIQRQRPLTNQALERYMLLINDLAGVTARATLSRSDVSGAADLSIEIEEKPYDASLSVNNRGSDFLGPHQLIAQGTANKLSHLYHPTGLTIVTTGNDELQYGLLTHATPIGGEGLKANVSVSRSSAAPGGDLEVLDINTDTTILGAGLSYPFIRSRTKNLRVRGDLSAYDSESERLRSAEGSDALDTEDRLRSLRLGSTFDNIDSHGGLNLLDIELSQGLEIFGSSETGDPGLSREKGETDYSKIKVYAARLQAINNQWSVLGALTGQYSSDNLLSSEQFGVGGEQFVRGYDSSEIVGDSGLAAKLELRYARAAKSKWLDSSVAYGFIDGGMIDRNSSDGEDDNDSRTSTGLGIRYRIFKKFTGYIELAVPLSSEDISSEGDSDARIFFQIGTSH